jgi:hypothetical protein
MTKTTILLGAAAGAMMLLGAGGAWAECDLNQRQYDAGWTCVAGEETKTATGTCQQKTAGPNITYQIVYDVTTTETAYNPDGVEVSVKNGDSITERKALGQGYDTPELCLAAQS